MLRTALLSMDRTEEDVLVSQSQRHLRNLKKSDTNEIKGTQVHQQQNEADPTTHK